MGRITEAALMANTHVFAVYGRMISHKIGSVLIFLVGVGALAFFAVGLMDLDYETDLDKLWVEEGSRAEDEMDFFKESFGGLTRIEQIVLTVKDGADEPSDVHDPGVLTAENLEALKDISYPVFYDVPQLNMTRTFKRDGADTEITFSQRDFCDRPQLPEIMGSYAANTADAYNSVNAVGAWLAASKVASGPLSFLTQCLATKSLTTAGLGGAASATDAQQMNIFYAYGGAFDPTLTGLPNGWGLDKAPCTKSSALDCFADGMHDYPDEFVELNNYGLAISALFSSDVMLTIDGNPATWWSAQCMAELESVSVSTIELLQSVPNAVAQAVYDSTIEPATTELALRFGAVGYWWRPPISIQSDVSEAVFTGVKNSVNLGGANCVAASLLNILSMQPGIPCCVNWGLTSVSSGLFIGGTDPDPIIDFSSSATVSFSNTPSPTPSSSENTSESPSPTPSTTPVSQSPTQSSSETASVTPSNSPPTASPTPSSSPENTHFARAMKISYSLANADDILLTQRLKNERDIDELSLDEQEDLLLDWEQVLKDYLDPMFEGEGEFASGGQYDHLELDYFVERAIRDMLDDASEIETHLLIIGYAVLIVFAMLNFVLFRCPPSVDAFVYSRSLLCLLGVGVIGGATVASFGFCGWIGLKLSPTNAMLVPFLSMGLGIDDLFVLMHELMRHHKSQDNPEIRVVHTMADAGSSVTVTSVANAVAFLIASNVRVSAVYTFAYQMAIAILMNWFSLLMVFGPLMYFDSVRAQKRVSMGCIRAENSETDTVGHPKFSVEHMVEAYIGPLYSNPIFKGVMLVVFVGLTAGLGALGFLETEHGLLLSDVSLEGTALRGFVLKQEDYFGLLPGVIVTRTIDYTQDGEKKDFKDYQSHVIQGLTDAGNNYYLDKVNTPYSLHFLPDLIDYVSEDKIVNGVVDPSLFYSELQGFITTVGASSANSLVCRDETSKEIVNCLAIDGENITLIATRGTVYYNNINSDDDYIDSIESVRETMDDSGANHVDCCVEPFGEAFDPENMFLHGSLMKYWQQYVGIETMAIKIVGYALCGVFGATLFFQASPLSSLLVLIMLLATVLQLYGTMALNGVKLNAFSVVNLAIAVGMGVEFTAHMSYAFLRANARAQDRDGRMRLALAEMYPPMLNGALTTFISVVCLAFAKYPFFSLYYFQMIAIMILLAFVNGMVFLPIILSLIGPAGLDKEHQVRSMSKANSGDRNLVEDDL